MDKKYNYQTIEQKWQQFWQKQGIFIVKENNTKPKFYALDMFPYPSGEGLHVGHPKGYIATDVMARYKMLNGYNVLHPMGFDSFGLPAENYALQHKIHPKIAVDKNIQRYKDQLKMFGFTYDWDRQVITSDPDYYKWTQWIFLQMFHRGLTYQSNEPINWCPSCKTGLANEDLEDDKCERCGSEVEKKPLQQWVLRITDYAERLLDDLKLVNWEDSIIEMQKNWIGKSSGSLIKFQITNNKSQINHKSQITNLKSYIEVFTTRPDTLFGATFMVVCPEHQLVASLLEIKNQKSKIKNIEEIKKYVNKANNKSELERTDLAKEKTGVEIKGIKAINPANNQEIPIFVADYVLPHYGTGAIMAVPAHDQRDYEFAQKYNIPIKIVIEAVLKQTTDSSAFHENEPFVEHHGVIVLLKHWKEDKYLGLRWRDAQDWGTLLTGGLDDHLSPEERALKEIHEETGYKHAKIIRQIAKIHSKYYHLPKQDNRFAHTQVFLVQLLDGEHDEIAQDEKSRHELIWMEPNELQSFLTAESHKTSLGILRTGVYTGFGQLVNSGKFDGMDSEKAKDAITKFVNGKKTIQYKLKDWVFARQRYWGEPFPIVFCEECKKRLENSKFQIPNSKQITNSKFKIQNFEYSTGEILNPGWIGILEEDLPVKLPEVKSYQPTGTGESPLANIKDWVKATCPKCGGAARRETNTMPQWAGSSWYYLAYTRKTQNSKLKTQNFLDKNKIKYWLEPKGVDLYVGGAEHATRHLIYARFWHKFLYDMGIVTTKEPFYRLQHVGLINGEDGRKMSKRWGNVINPDEVIKQYGADALRCYEMFMGPFADSIAWSTQGVKGVYRFLDKLYNLVEKFEIRNSKFETNPKSKIQINHKSKIINLKSNNILINQTIKKVTDDIENFRFNTAISSLMILVNEMSKNSSSFDHSAFYILNLLISPFAPHLAEELWSQLGNKDSIFQARWPECDPQKIKSATITIPVQINGKVRANIEVESGTEEKTIVNLALQDKKVQKHLAGQKIKKTIYIPSKILSIVI